MPPEDSIFERLAQRENVAFETQNTAYHGTSRHGAQNSAENMAKRHVYDGVYTDPKMFKNSPMVNELTQKTGQISRQAESSKFTQPSWDKHVRNEAHAKFASEAAKGNHEVIWEEAPPKHNPVNVQNFGIQSTEFHMHYPGREIGEVSQLKANPSQNPTDTVKVVMNWRVPNPNHPHQITAWMGQIYPIPRANITAPKPSQINVRDFDGTNWRASDLNPFHNEVHRLSNTAAKSFPVLRTAIKFLRMIR